MPNQQPALDHLFAALADPTRRAVLDRLSQGPATVSELAQPFTMSLPSLLQHLQVLESSGLIRSAKQGRVRTCELQPAALGRAEQWIAERRATWSARLDRLEAYFEQTKDTCDAP